MAFPIFVLEGPDNSGKSTLAKAIARKCRGKIMHQTYRFKGRMMKYHLAAFRMALKTAQKSPVILDRWWPSEVAYGNTFRNGPEPDFDIELLQELGKAYNVSYTYCMPTRWEEYWGFCNKVWRQEEEMYQKDEAKYNWLWKCYRELMLQNYSYYPQNTIQHYNVTIDISRENGTTGFADYVINRMRNQTRILQPEQKDLMRRMSRHWRLVGKVPLSELPPIDEPIVAAPIILKQPVQGILL